MRAGAGGPFRDLLDFCQRVDSGKLNRRVLEALVQAGALDSLGANRASLMLQLPEVMKATEQLAREREAGQASLFGGGGDLPEIRIELPVAPDWPLEQKLHRRTRDPRPFPQRPSAGSVAGRTAGAGRHRRSATSKGSSARRTEQSRRSAGGARRPGDRGAPARRQPGLRADRGHARPARVRLLQRGLQRVRAAAVARPHHHRRGRRCARTASTAASRCAPASAGTSAALCAQYGQRLALTVDLREARRLGAPAAG